VANFNRAVKGVSYFVEAAPAILESVPRARFVILGRGKEEAVLRRRASELGVDAHVLFAGYRADIDRYYQAMDVSVLTSLSEGCSMTVLESMNHGLPVVVTNVGGNPELVTDGETGYLVPAGDPRAFAARVVELLRSPSLREQMGTAARRRVESRFRLEDVAGRYLRVYSAAMDSGTAKDGRCPLASPSPAAD
jgi:glycosyltransferase involved in cell wall biosynthesis